MDGRGDEPVSVPVPAAIEMMIRMTRRTKIPPHPIPVHFRILLPVLTSFGGSTGELPKLGVVASGALSRFTRAPHEEQNLESVPKAPPH